MIRFLQLGALFALLALGCACRDPKTQQKGCNIDSDCGSPAAAYRCEVQTGVCYCRTNDACPSKQFCNTAGFCQDRSGCEKNADCLDANLFCDTTAGSCLSKGRCSIDLHCPLGQVCDTTKGACVEGCHSNGDCNGTSCRCGEVACSCTGVTQAEVAKCPVGVCDPNFCANETFCKFGEQCGKPPDAGNVRSTCFSDYDPNRRPYCATCTFGGGTNVCGTGANYCLIDTAHPGNYYCGADCSQGQSCPRGYACQDVIVVGTANTERCGGAQGCTPNSQLPCGKDEDCKRGGKCFKAAGAPNGFCQAPCLGDEGGQIGFCSCQIDSDCAQESCSAGECTISRRKCVTQSDCRAIHCVDFEGAGGCLIGQNCAPSNGLSCLEVQ